MAKSTKRGQDDVGVGIGGGKKTVYRKPKVKKLSKLDFPFLRYVKNEAVNTSLGTSIDFIGYDDGFTDYDLLGF